MKNRPLSDGLFSGALLLFFATLLFFVAQKISITWAFALMLMALIGVVAGVMSISSPDDARKY
jgi:hypothetical protein